MAKEIAGKIFYTAEEAKAAGFTQPTAAEIELARKLFDEFQKKVDAVSTDRVREVSPKFWDDTSGTEYEHPREA